MTVPPVQAVRARTEMKSVSASGFDAAWVSPSISGASANASVSRKDKHVPAALKTKRASKDKPAHPRPVSVSRSAHTGPSPTGALMVGSGTGVDEEAVKRDLEIMEDVEKEDARALLQWCEERSLREELENFPKDGDLSNLGKRSGQLSN